MGGGPATPKAFAWSEAVSARVVHTKWDTLALAAGRDADCQRAEFTAMYVDTPCGVKTCYHKFLNVEHNSL